MEEQSSDKSTLTDKAKTALLNAGIIPQLKQAVYADDVLKADNTERLNSKAQATAESLQQLIDSGTLNDTDTQRLTIILSHLRGALQGGRISREALVAALAEATTALSTTTAAVKNVTEQQKVNQLWQKIEKCNETINDDFEKMQEEGIVFDKKLLEKHKQLLEHLKEHPHDIEKQKELNAVDDQMLKQAEAQLAKHQDAKPHYDDAKKQSDDRHQMVDKDLKIVKNSTIKTQVDWDEPYSEEKNGNKIYDVTMDDVKSPNIGHHPKGKGKDISI